MHETADRQATQIASFSDLARDHRRIAELNARISNSPDYLVEELMNRHGWPAHEAICAVQQLQETALRQTSDQAD